jgi:hypothetical protein
MPHYDEERLVRLLRLLRAVPREWVRRAQRIPAQAMTLTERDVDELGRKLEREPSFRRQFDADPVAAVSAAGMRELGLRLEREIRELVVLAEGLAGDSALRAEVVADPIAALGAAGLPVAAADVEAHVLGKRPLEERLLLLLLTSSAVVDQLRAAAR